MKVVAHVKHRGHDRPLEFYDVLELRETPLYLEIRMREKVIFLPHTDIILISQTDEPGAHVPFTGTKDPRYIARMASGGPVSKRQAEQVNAAGPIHGAVTPVGFRPDPEPAKPNIAVSLWSDEQLSKRIAQMINTTIRENRRFRR
jgi:hypothetical protein